MPPQSITISARRLSFETASIFSLLITLVIATVLFIPGGTLPLLPTKTFILAVGGIITLALYILARLSRGNIIVPPSVMLGALWLPTIGYALSTLFSGTNTGTALFGEGFSPDTLGFMLMVSMLGTLTALTLRRPEHYRLLLLTAGGLALGVAVIELGFVIVGQFAPNLISPATSLVGSLTDLSAFAGLVVIGVLLSLRLLTLPRRARIALYGSGAISLFFLALLHARLELVIVGVVALGLFVESVMRQAPANNDTDLEEGMVLAESEVVVEDGERSLAAPLATLAIALFFLIGGNLSNSLATALNVSALDVRPSWQATLGVGQEVYRTSPLFGSGPSTFGGAWLSARDASLNQTIFWNVDFTSGIGFIPTSFITTGLIGALLWLGLFALLLYYGARTILLNTTRDPFLRFVTVFAFAGAVYLGIVALGAAAGPIMLALLFVFLGLFASVIRYAPRKTQWGIIFARSPRIGFVIVFGLTLVLLASIVAAYVVVERYLAQIEFANASRALAAGESSSARVAADRSLALADSSEVERLHAQISQAEMRSIASDTKLSAAAASQAFQQALSRGITAATAATRLGPNDYRNWMALADLYAVVVPLGVEGAYENAKSAYEKATTLNPTSPIIPYAKAQLEIGAKDAVAAKSNLTAAIALKQDYVPAIFLLSQLEVATGNVAEALAAAEAAAYFTPNDPGVLFQVGILRASTGDTARAIEALAAAVTVDTKFANARYFLAALYAKQGSYEKAVSELEALAELGEENAVVVAPLIQSLLQKKNPFPANLLSASPPTL